MTTAMQRAAHRMKKQRQNIAMTRSMGVLSGASAPAAYLAVDGAAGLAAALFLAFSSVVLLVNTAG